MNEIKSNERMEVIRLYFLGLSYDEIVEKSGVSKGTVSNIVAELNEGKYDELKSASEQLEALRKLAVELNKSGGKLLDALKGAILLNRLEELGLDLHNLETWRKALAKISSPDYESEKLVDAAIKVVIMKEEAGAKLEQVPELIRTKLQELKELDLRIQSTKESAERLEAELEEKKRIVGEEIQKAEKSLQDRKQKVEAESVRLEKTLQDRLHKHRLEMSKMDLLTNIISKVPDVERFRLNVKAYGGLIETLDRLHSIVSSLERDVKNLEKSKSDSQKGLEAKKIEGEKAKQALEKDISELRKKADVARGEMRTLDDALELKKKQHQEALRQIESDLEKARSEAALKASEIANETKALEEKKNSLSELLDTVSAFFHLFQDSENISVFEIEKIIHELQQIQMAKRGKLPRVTYLGESPTAKSMLARMCLDALNEEVVSKDIFDGLKETCEHALSLVDSYKKERDELELKCSELERKHH